MPVNEGESSSRMTFRPLSAMNKQRHKAGELEKGVQTKEGKLWRIILHNSEKPVMNRFPLIRQKR